MQNGWYWLNTGWGCGGIFVDNGIIAITAPIFRKFKGSSISKVELYELKWLGPELA